jgi:DNA-directed RNA polymerase subunit H (RpoH/RPB5)
MKIIFKSYIDINIMSVNIELNSKEINIEVCINILKMLKRRKLIDDVDASYSDISGDINQKSTIEIKLNNGTKCSIYSINAKLSSIAQGTPLDDYLSSNLDLHKIVILKEAAKKVLKQIQQEYKNAEFFFEHEMLEDIPSKVFIPEHQLLNNEEKNELLEKLNENELPIIFDTDIMSRYYNAKFGDIFRIVRSSLTSGTSIAYRRVAHGSLDLLYS